MGHKAACAVVALAALAAACWQRHPLKDSRPVEGIGLEYRFESRIQYVEVHFGQPILTDAQGIHAFHLTIRLHKHVRRRSVSDCFHLTSAAENDTNHISEITHGYIRRVVEPPLIKNRNQKVRAWRRSIALSNRSDRVVRKERQEVGELGAAQRRHEMTVDGEWISP